MKFKIHHLLYSFLLTPFLLTSVVQGVVAQDTEVITREAPSAKKAFVRSLVLPGWGHRYAQGGSWRGKATLFVGADVGLWLGLANSIWRRNHLIQSYQTLAASQAGASIAGKDRAFYLNLATYQSSDAYLEAQLRNRNWDRLDYVSDPAFQWDWASEEEFFRYRELREDAETHRRRRSLFIAALVANRLLAGISSIQAANKAGLSLSLSAPPAHEEWPVLHASLRLSGSKFKGQGSKVK